MNEQLSPFAAAALSIVEEGGAIMKANHERPHTIRRKGRIDLVTETDFAIEAFLKERLAVLTPEEAFLAEESAESLDLPPTCWIIDPVDGTTNFAHGLPLTVTSVAYRLNGEIVLGIVNAAPRMLYCGKGERGMAQRGTHQRLIRDGLRECPHSYRFSL